MWNHRPHFSTNCRRFRHNCRSTLKIHHPHFRYCHKGQPEIEPLSSMRYTVCSFSSSLDCFDNLTLCMPGSREQAFVYALSSALLMRSVAKGCGSGATTKCQCGKIPVEPSTADFRWGGCSDDVTFGSVFSRSFTDTKWKQKKRPSTKSLTILHNNAVGRKVGRLCTLLQGYLIGSMTVYF